MAYSKVERSTWNDERFRSWPRDTREIWLYLMTSPHMDRPGGRVGCYVLDPMYAAADLSCPDDRWTPERVEEQLHRLEADGRIIWDPSARLVLLRHFFRHNQPENPNVAKGAANDVDELPFSETVLKGLLEAVEHHLPTHFEKDGQRRGECGAVIAARVRARLEKARPVAKNNTFETVTPTVTGTVTARFAKQEHEQEQEHLTTTGSDDPEAAPRGSNSSEASGIGAGSGPVDPTDRKALHALFAPLVREHLWLGKRPPPGILRSDPKWGMHRELNILVGFVEAGRASPEEVAGAIEVARPVLGFDASVPLSARLFNVADRHDRLEVCVAYWRRKQPTKLQPEVQQLVALVGGAHG